MKTKIIKCPVCGNEYDGSPCVDPCPNCEWLYDFSNEEDGDPNEVEVNPVSLNTARELYKQGKNKWGDMLPKNIYNN